MVDFGGNRYIGYGAPPLPYTVGERLGTVQVGPCRDTGPDTPAEASETATLFRIDGLDPTDGLAISWDGAPGSTDLLAGQDADGGITPGFQAFLEAHGR